MIGIFAVVLAMACILFITILQLFAFDHAAPQDVRRYGLQEH